MPQCPYPWRAEWEVKDNRYIFVNGQTGERSNQLPGGVNDSKSHGGGTNGPSHSSGPGPAYDGGYG